MARRRGGGRRGRTRATVTITGIARLRQRLEDLPDDIKAALAKGVQESAEAVRDDTRRRVPVASGNLRDKVAVKTYEGGLICQVGWFDPADYYAVFVEYGTRTRPAQPSLHPALQAERGRYKARLTAEVRKVLR